MTGTVFNIQRFSTEDGPGIRTTVFMKGCPLRCKWCHNPEGLRMRPQLQHYAEKCIGCGACLQVCENHRVENDAHVIDFAACRLCGACVDVCPSGALSICGKEYESAALAEIIQKDAVFYTNNGGVTFSGGEALLQADFVAETMQACPNMHRAVDTCGYVPWSAFEKTLPYTDLYLYDIKAFHPDVHQAATGVSNELILENLKKLDQAKPEIWVRIPVIPGVNYCDEEMLPILEFVRPLTAVTKVELMAYHSLGKEKYATIGMEAPFETTEEVDITHYQNLFDEMLKNK